MQPGQNNIGYKFWAKAAEQRLIHTDSGIRVKRLEGGDGPTPVLAAVFHHHNYFTTF